MKHKSILYFLLLIILSTAVIAQETIEIPEGESDDQIFVINSFVFNVDGITRAFALNLRTEFKVGEEITGADNLDRFIRDKRQLLYNERVLETVRIEYTVLTQRADGKFPVDLVIYVKDTWNIIALPHPQYSSNTGFALTIKARDYNFLGTMSSLRADFGYRYDELGRTFINLNMDSGIPFRAYGLNWVFRHGNEYIYRPTMERPHYFRNVTGLSVELPVQRTVFTVGINEHFIFYEENPDDEKPMYGGFQDFYLSSRPFINWRIPTGLHYYDLGEITYTPGISATFNYAPPHAPLTHFRQGPFLGFNHNLSFGRINWRGNFRSGASASIANSFSYNIYNANHGHEPWGANLNIRGTGHKQITDFFGFSTRLMYRQWFYDSYSESAADVLRGILNNKITANYMLSMNLDLNFRLFRFSFSEWFNITNRYFRIFDCDVHMIPIIDAALYNDPVKQKIFGLENLLLTSGLEVIIFPRRMRSLFLRVSYARNFSVGPKPNSSEIYIGTDLHF